MRKLSLVSLFDIQLFGEGAGGGDGGTGGGDAGAASAALAQPQQGVKSNPLADVQYGKEESVPAAGEHQEAKPADDRASKFEALIKGEYKDLYDARVQDTIRRRLKGSEETVNRYNKLSSSFDLLGRKYGLDPSAPDFVDKLSQEIEKDETYFEDEALESGLTVQQVKEKRQILRENAALKQQLDEAKGKEQGDALAAALVQQSEQVKRVYPSFDLNTELQNEQFRTLLRANIPMQTAFEVIHKDEILPAAMQYTAQQVGKKIANSVAAGQKRPAEGAMNARSAITRKSDVSQLTKADIEEINRRVARGEKISF